MAVVQTGWPRRTSGVINRMTAAAMLLGDIFEKYSTKFHG
jgi:hypothetical protein